MALFATDSGTLLRSFAIGRGPVRVLAFAGDALLAGGDDGALYAWDAASGAERFRRPVGGAIHRLALSPDRRRAAVASTNRVAVIELGGGALVETLDWHEVQVLGLAWAGDTLATGDVAGHVALWDTTALHGKP